MSVVQAYEKVRSSLPGALTDEELCAALTAADVEHELRTSDKEYPAAGGGKFRNVKTLLLKEKGVVQEMIFRGCELVPPEVARA